MAFWSWPRYVAKAEKQARAAKKLEKLKKKGLIYAKENKNRHKRLSPRKDCPL